MEATFKELNTTELAYRTLKDGRYYFAGEDTVSLENPGYMIEYLIGKMRLYGTTFVTQDFETGGGHLRFSHWGAGRDEADVFIKKLSACEYWNYNHGHFTPQYGTLSDKEFYAIRGFMVSLCKSGKTPNGFEYDGGAGFYKGVKLFWYDESECKFNGFGGLMMDERLSYLIDMNEKMRTVQDGILRKAINKFFGWTFKTTNSIGEYHFSYDAESKKIVCKYLCGTKSRTYNVGKGLERIAMIMGAEAPNEKQVKELDMWLKSYGTGTLEVVEGSDIVKYYHWGRYERDVPIGSLDGSCMKYDEYQDCVDNMYRDNAKMLILRSNNNPDKILGRALLWECVDGTKAMDRIYGAEHQYPLFKKWAKDNGYAHRARQNYSEPWKFVTPDGDEVMLQLKVKLSRFDEYGYDDGDDYYDEEDEMRVAREGNHAIPYMDTFKFVDTENRILLNHAPAKDSEGEWYLCERTDGIGERQSTQYNMCYTWNEE
jgi:hypothetical protein